MSAFDLKNRKLGDWVEYERPSRQATTCGTFLDWYAAADGQTYPIVRNQPLGMDIFVDPQRVISITRQGENTR